VSKKRYVGHSLEDSEQKMPKLDAKGIELVRRDQCPLVTRMQVRAHYYIHITTHITICYYMLLLYDLYMYRYALYKRDGT
jgi:DNA polymerase elongation subunit (family B)